MKSLRLLLCGLAMGACTVPSLSDLEKEQPRACDANHACAQGYSCLAGVCRTGGGGDCLAGTTQACGSAVGECVEGTQTCGEDLKWGACVGGVPPAAEVCDGKDNDCNQQVDDNVQSSPLCPLQQGVCAGKRRRCISSNVEPTCVSGSYGADYELAETRCDGLDNDCDGQTDEALTVLCGLQQGVCAGASVQCAGSSDAGCGAATYSARDARYETFETRCDGVDNDCDGLVDDWPLQNLSTSDGGSAKPVAAKMPSGSLLVMWEETTAERKVLGRVVAPDGTLGAPTEPSTSASLALRSYAPALYSDGNELWGAWIEEPTSSTKRVMVAPLGANGRSSLPSANAYSVTASAPTSVGVAADEGVGRVLLAAANGAGIELTAFTSGSFFPDAGQVGNTVTLTASGSAPRVAPAGNGFFWVTYLAGTTVTRCLVDATLAALPSSCGPVASASFFATPFPLTGTSPYLVSIGAVWAPTDGGQRLPGLFDCDAGSCSGAAIPTGQGVSSLATDLGFSAVARNQRPAVYSYEDPSVGTGVYFGRTDGGVPQTVSGALTGAHHPVPVMLGPGRAAVVFDTGGNTTGFPAGEVVLKRVCVP